MQKYYQPDQYHFGQDSVDLARWATARTKYFPHKRVIEFGAGCGVLSLEFLSLLEGQEVEFKLVELQEEFIPALSKNISLYGKGCCEYLRGDILRLDDEKYFDCVLMNPPYFIDSKYRQPACTVKNRCRHISEEDLIGWFETARRVLKNEGELFFCFRDSLWLKVVSDKWKCIDRQEMNNYVLHHWQKS